MAQDCRMIAYKTPWCGYCDGWVTHMRGAGWTVEVVERLDLGPIRAYAIEGHVPAADVARLLRERPQAVALAAPGMPGFTWHGGGGTRTLRHLADRPQGPGHHLWPS